MQSVWGYTDQELIGHAARRFHAPGRGRAGARVAAPATRGRTAPSATSSTCILTRNGETRWLLMNAVGIFDDAGQRVGLRGTGRDITDRKNAEARISYLATRDPLTELPNRVLFNDRLEQGIVAARRSGQSLALLFIDLDRFKNINDSLGHQVGDLLLKEVATRMHGCIRKGDTLSRLGGDEFVVTLEGLQQAEDAAQVAAKIIKALSRPFEIAGHTLNTSCSHRHQHLPARRRRRPRADEERRHGDVSRQGEGPQQLPVLLARDERARGRAAHPGDGAAPGHRAPGVRAATTSRRSTCAAAKVVGMEALLRWQHPERGLLVPGDLHRRGRGIRPDRADRAVGAAQRLPARARPGRTPATRALKVAVNISPRQLIQPARVLARHLAHPEHAPGSIRAISSWR